VPQKESQPHIAVSRFLWLVRGTGTHIPQFD
jgi:hypothetical protein